MTPWFTIKTRSNRCRGIDFVIIREFIYFGEKELATDVTGQRYARGFALRIANSRRLA